MDSQHSRRQAARCLQLAEQVPSAKLRGVLVAEARAWISLAEDQEWLEQRSTERASHDTVANLPTIHAALRSRAGVLPSRRER
jgi:hypothetical protein